MHDISAQLIPLKHALTAETAWQLWNEAAHAHEISRLQLELKQLQEHMTTHFDESVHKRVLDLQEALKAAQNRRTFAPMTADAAF